jgi:ABC-type spermidine/putrescine transport system permease subunit I
VAKPRYWSVTEGPLVIPAVLLFTAVYLYPLSRLVTWSFFAPGFSLQHYRALFAEPAYVTAFVNTLDLSLTVTAMTLALGYPVAYLMTTVSPRTRAIVLACVLVPFWTSILVRTFAWMVLLGRNGLLNHALVALGLVTTPVPLIHNRIGVQIGMVHVLLPLMILPLYSVMARIDPAWLRAARSLGARPWQAFFHVFLPLSLPGIGAGGALVFLSSIGFFVTPALLGGPKQITIAMLIDLMINDLLNWGFGAALALMLLVVVTVLFMIFQRALRLDRVWGGAV